MANFLFGLLYTNDYIQYYFVSTVFMPHKYTGCNQIHLNDVKRKSDHFNVSCLLRARKIKSTVFKSDKH